ncbi:flagellar protein FlbD [Granulicella rosea]|uniref:Flagellar protein FlbD n=1 Tax=Granulicella rosea TaxID=474952 RepID=A0A239ISL8_9BACT|nr:flagellar FlbD family protein [Granulicella rosea]SNS96382.1 flagellar protein FlbD [Granulicella rosea]
MIELTRLNGHRLVVNCDLIKFAEATPDTTLTLVTGEKLIVLESCETLEELILNYHSSILSQAWRYPSRGAVSALEAVRATSE